MKKKTAWDSDDSFLIQTEHGERWIPAEMVQDYMEKSKAMSRKGEAVTEHQRKQAEALLKKGVGFMKVKQITGLTEAELARIVADCKRKAKKSADNS